MVKQVVTHETQKKGMARSTNRSAKRQPSDEGERMKLRVGTSVQHHTEHRTKHREEGAAEKISAAVERMQQSDGEWRPHARLVPVRDPKAVARRAWRGYPRAEHVGTGNHPHSSSALRRTHAVCFPCSTPGCCALVEWQTAKRLAKACGQTDLKHGAGCGSRTCSKDYRAAKFRQRQSSRAAGLLHGEWLLIRRPSVLQPECVWVQSSRETAMAAAMAMAAASE